MRNEKEKEQELQIRMDMPSSFEVFCRELNETCKALQDAQKEVLAEADAFAAYACVKNMRIADAGDVVLFCAAMNLLNTYVKQDQDDIGYAFKQETEHLIGILWNVPIDDVLVDYQMDNGSSLLVVEVFGLQFSFHRIAETEELKKLDAKNAAENVLKWDGVRKQMCAKTLFERAAANEERRCMETYRGKDLREKIDQMLDNFHAGRTSFNDLINAI